MKRFLNWLFWLPFPAARKSREALLDRIILMEFWNAECKRIHAEFLKEETIEGKLRYYRQYQLASHRFDMEVGKK